MISISGYPISNKENNICDIKNYLRLNNCGYLRFITKSMTIHRKNGRNDYQLIYVLSGYGRFKLGAKSQNVCEGNMVLYRPGEEQYYIYNADYASELYWVHFTGAEAEKLIASSGFSGKQVYPIGESSILVNYYKKIMQELQFKKPLYREAANAALIELLVYVGRKINADEQKYKVSRDDNLHGVIELLHSGYHLEWSIDKLAGIVNLSPYRFMHNFKAYTGMSAIEYLTKIRIEKAKDLLSDSRLSVKAVSNAVGYSNPLYFSTLFRKSTGVSPSNYRRMLV